MNAKNLFKQKGVIVFTAVASAIVVLMLAVTILTTTVFYQLINTVLGGPKRILADDGDGNNALYVSDYDTKTEAFNAANALNVTVNEEGIVLLKNEKGALPLNKGSKVNVFGKNSVDLVYGGSGSGAGSKDGRVTLYESLTAAGIEYNATLKSFYDGNASGDGRPANPPIENTGGVYLSTGETPVSMYTDGVWSSCESTDIKTALVVFSRIGGEGFDLPRNMKNKAGTGAVDGANADDHYLQLDNNERELLKKVCSLSNIEHVIVLVNSNTSMELGFLDDAGHYAYADKIDGALWIGGPGNSGVTAIGRVLVGDVNPSGRLIDTYARDFTKDPSIYNFGNNNLIDIQGRRTYTGNQYMKSASESYPYYYVDYEEGIYVGYRYWETRGFTEGTGAYTGDIKGTATTSWDSWYDAHVVYPFGYGLSYTTFSREVKNAAELASKDLKDGKFTISVEVKNTGSKAGKEVVEIYATPKYNAGGIEKPHKLLCGFGKTPTLYPANEAGADKPNSYTLDIEIDPYYIASYDYDDANGNTFKGYELEKGEYVFSVAKNAHDAGTEVKMNLSVDVRYGEDPETGVTVKNRFDDIDDQLSDVTVGGKTRKGLSRTDWTGTWPTTRVNAADRVTTEAFIAALESADSHNPNVSKYEMPKYAKSAPGSASVTIQDMHGKDYNDDDWDALLDQITLGDLQTLISDGNFHSAAILYVGKPETLESDGPVGFVNFMDKAIPPKYYDTCSYASECVMAATWNVELIYEVGKSIGNEGLHGNERGDGAPYSGLYAPGANIHRTPFGGRNYEYFSEDPFLSGMLAANEIKGAAEKGVYLYMKHFVANEQETSRDKNGVVTWLTEQSLREIYLRPFEMAVKIGKTTAIMSSFNRLGATWTGGDYRLLTEVLREEWGFKGTVICDFNLSTYMVAEQMHYAGGDLNLTTMANNKWEPDYSKASDVYVMRSCAKNILYTVANSCVVKDKVVGYILPTWTIVLIIVDCLIAVGLGVWGFFAIRKGIKAEAGVTSESKEQAEDPEKNEQTNN